MTVQEAISEIDAMKPNAFAPETKARWISECEGDIEVHVRYGKATKLRYPEDAGKELSVPHPYDKLYVLYLDAAIDYRMRDYAAYQNSYAMYNAAYEDYARYYERSQSSAWREEEKK